jgi:hypothetical protein
MLLPLSSLAHYHHRRNLSLLSRSCHTVAPSQHVTCSTFTTVHECHTVTTVIVTVHVVARSCLRRFACVLAYVCTYVCACVSTWCVRVCVSACAVCLRMCVWCVSTRWCVSLSPLPPLSHLSPRSPHCPTDVLMCCCVDALRVDV